MLKLVIFCLWLTGFGILHSDGPADSYIRDFQPEPWRQLVGQPAPEWSMTDWINSQPLSLADLKGKVVLIRWWLESCPYCQATAPSLNEFAEAYTERGLVVLGMYHAKPRGIKATKQEVKRFAQVKGFKFPIAIDHNWEILEKFWPSEIEMKYTSVSFLLDQKGIIRYIHPGGSYNAEAQPFDNLQWAEDYLEIKRNIENLLL